MMMMTIWKVILPLLKLVNEAVKAFRSGPHSHKSGTAVVIVNLGTFFQGWDLSVAQSLRNFITEIVCYKFIKVATRQS